jgi:hypothetical protein
MCDGQAWGFVGAASVIADDPRLASSFSGREFLLLVGLDGHEMVADTKDVSLAAEHNERLRSVAEALTRELDGQPAYRISR